MNIYPISGKIGAEVKNIDLAKPSVAMIEEVKEALQQYKVLVFKNQTSVGAAELAVFSECFGEPITEPHRAYKDFPGHPSVKITTTNGIGHRGGFVDDTWHTDGSMDGRIDTITFLQAIDVPPYGRDTVFADMEAAYEILSPALQKSLEGLVSIHMNPAWATQRRGGELPVHHPVILEDPRTGRKTLYVNHQYTHAILDMRPEDSQSLLQILFRMPYMPEVQVRVSWQIGTIAMWENRRTQHYLVHDMVYPRVMHRIMVDPTRQASSSYPISTS